MRKFVLWQLPFTVSYEQISANSMKINCAGLYEEAFNMRTRDVSAILACGTAYRKSSPSPWAVFYFHVQFIII